MNSLLKILVGLLVIVLSMFFAISSWIKTEYGELYLQNHLSDWTEKNWGASIEIEDVDLSFVSGLSIGNVSLYQKEQKIGSVSGLNIYVIPSIFMLWKINIPLLHVDSVELLRMPELPAFESQEKIQQDNFVLSAIPQIYLQKIDIKKLYISQDVSKIPGGIECDVIGMINANFHKMNVKFRLDSNFDSQIKSITGANLYIDGEYNISEQKLNIRNHNVNSSILNITGNTVFDQRMQKIVTNAAYVSYIKDFKKIKKGLIEGKIQLNGKLNALDIVSDGKLLYNLNIGIEEEKIADYHTELSLNNTSLSGKLDVKQDTLIASGNIGYVNNKFSFNNFTINGDGLSSDINLDYDLVQNIIVGKVEYQDDSLHEFSKYFPGMLGGSMHVDATFSALENDKQGLKLDASIAEVATLAGDMQNIEVAFDSSSLFEKQVNYFNVLVRYFYTDSVIIKNIILNAKSSSGGLIEFESKLSSRSPCLINFETKGSLSLNDKFKLNVPYLKGNIGKSEISLLDPLSIVMEEGLKVDMKGLKVGEGLMRMDVNLLPEKLMAELDMQNISTKICDKIVTRNFKNVVINGKANLSGKSTQPRLQINMNTQHMLPKDAGVVNFDIKGLVDNTKSDLNINLIQQDKKIGSLTAKFKNEFSLAPFIFQVNKNDGFMASFELNNSLDILSLLPRFKGQEISGNLTGKVAISGSLENPNIIGGMKLRDGKYKFKTHGVKIKDVRADIKPAKGGFLINNISAKDHKDKLVSGVGEFIISDGSYDFKLRAKNFHPLSNAYVDGALAGEVNYKGDTNGALIQGDLLLGPLEIRIPEHFTANIPEANVVQTLDKSQFAMQNRRKNSYQVNLDLKVKTGKKVFVRGLGVDTRLQGKMIVTGDVFNPEINGSLRTVEGKFQEFGRTLNVEKSTLIFDGPLDPSPYLNIVGVTNIDDIDIRVMLYGSIAEPVLNVSSSPSMKQEKILSLLLFGTTTDNISPVQAIQLASSGARLSGKSGIFDPIDLSKKVFNIDDLNFGEDADNPGSYSLRAGKYLQEKIYFEVEHGMQDSSIQTRVEVQVTPKVSVELINRERESNVGVSWSMDY